MGKRKRLEPMTRQMVETVAFIVGPQSAAAQVLAAADAHGGDVRFWNDPACDTLIVEYIDADAKGDGR